MPQFLRPGPAERFLQENYGFGGKKSLDKLASVGGGPPFHKAGHARLYKPEALIEFALSKIGPPQTSTAQNAHPAPPARDPARPRGRPTRQRAPTDDPVEAEYEAPERVRNGALTA